MCLPLIAVFGAHGLVKRDLLSLPDPFAVLTVDGEQTCSTRVTKKSLSPSWNDSFDMCVVYPSFFTPTDSSQNRSPIIYDHNTSFRLQEIQKARSRCVLVQVWSLLHCSRCIPPGFLGVINIPASEVISWVMNHHGILLLFFSDYVLILCLHQK